MSETSARRIPTWARLRPHRQKIWLHSQNEEFRDKRDALLRLDSESPADEHMSCFDKKPGMQALERRYLDSWGRCRAVILSCHAPLPSRSTTRTTTHEP